MTCTDMKIYLFLKTSRKLNIGIVSVPKYKYRLLLECKPLKNTNIKT